MSMLANYRHLKRSNLQRNGREQVKLLQGFNSMQRMLVDALECNAKMIPLLWDGAVIRN